MRPASKGGPDASCCHGGENLSRAKGDCGSDNAIAGYLAQLLSPMCLLTRFACMQAKFAQLRKSRRQQTSGANRQDKPPRAAEHTTQKRRAYYPQLKWIWRLPERQVPVAHLVLRIQPGQARTNSTPTRQHRWRLAANQS